MPSGIAVIEYHTSRSGDEAMADALEQAELAGFNVEGRTEDPHAAGDARYLKIDYRQWQFSFVFNVQEDRNPGEPLLRIDCGNTIYPSETDDEAAYRNLLDTLFELLCRVATALDAEYAALFNPESRDAMPHSRPFVDGITELPRMGAYSERVINQFGGLDAMFGPSRWYTATLDERRTIVIDAKSGWLSGPWQPPTSSAFIEHAEFHP